MPLQSSRDIVLSGKSPGIRTGAEPYRMTDTRLSYGWANTLIEAATPQSERKTLPMVDYDFHRTITAMGRRVLFSIARELFWRVPPLQAAIQEQANLAASPFTARHIGANQAWGEQAFEWLQGWHKVMMIEGWPYDYDVYTEHLVSMSIVDGELHTLLTEDGSGNPRAQFIPTHRIGSRWVTGGQCTVVYDGNSLFIDDILIDDSLPWTFSAKVEFRAPIIDGVIVDGQSRPIAYRVYDDPAVSGSYKDISARSLYPCFFPMVPGQLRGISLLASSVFDWQDWRQWKTFEQLAQQAFSTRTIVETNETGEADAAKALIQTPATFNADGTKATLDTQKIESGTMTYLKARTGSKLEAFNWGDRPGRNAQDFQETTLRDAMAGSEWSVFFSLDPGHVGGAPMRVVVDKINRVLRKRRRMIAKSVFRADIYALAKAIKRGDLPFDPDWYKWTYQGGSDLTADRRYDAQTDAQEYELGWTNMQDIEERRNGDWTQKREQREKEVDDLYTRARRISQKHGVPIQEAAAQMSKPGNAFINLSEPVKDADTKDGQPGVGGNNPKQP